MTKNPYACPGCRGYRTVECYACGHEVDCEECDGTGLDPSKIDAQGFALASDALRREGGVSWDWVEDGVARGRRNDDRTLAYDDFLLPAAPGAG